MQRLNVGLSPWNIFRQAKLYTYNVVKDRKITFLSRLTLTHRIYKESWGPPFLQNIINIIITIVQYNHHTH